MHEAEWYHRTAVSKSITYEAGQEHDGHRLRSRETIINVHFGDTGYYVRVLLGLDKNEVVETDATMLWGRVLALETFTRTYIHTYPRCYIVCLDSVGSTKMDKADFFTDRGVRLHFDVSTAYDTTALPENSVFATFGGVLIEKLRGTWRK